MKRVILWWLILCLTVLFFFSCEFPLYVEKGSIVLSTSMSLKRDGMCIYKLNTSGDYIYLIDSCNKFHVGDTLTIKK